MPKVTKKLVPINQVIKDAKQYSKLNSMNSFPDGVFDHSSLRETLVWKSTGGGEGRKIKDLSDSHLKNILNSHVIDKTPKFKDFLELELAYRENNDEHVPDYESKVATPDDFIKFFGF